MTEARRTTRHSWDWDAKSSRRSRHRSEYLRPLSSHRKCTQLSQRKWAPKWSGLDYKHSSAGSPLPRLQPHWQELKSSAFSDFAFQACRAWPAAALQRTFEPMFHHPDRHFSAPLPDIKPSLKPFNDVTGASSPEVNVNVNVRR